MNSMDKQVITHLLAWIRNLTIIIKFGLENSYLLILHDREVVMYDRSLIFTNTKKILLEIEILDYFMNSIIRVINI